MAVLSGLLSSSTANSVDLVGEWQESILVRNAKGMGVGATLFGLMSRLKAEPADNTFYNWFERPPLLRQFVSTATSTSGSTTITLQDGSGNSIYNYLANGAILQNTRTSEFVITSGDPTTDAFTVVRGFGGSTAAAVNVNDLWVLISIAKDEGAVPTRALWADPTNLVNYIQTFNSSVNLTNAYKGQVLRTDLQGPLREHRIQALERITKDIELQLFFGKKSQSSGTNGYIYSTGGVVDSINTAGLTSNVLNGLGTVGVDYDTVSAWLTTFMTYGSESKLAFCGPTAYQAFSTYALNRVGFQLRNTETVMGIAIQELLTPFGVLSLCMHPLFTEISYYNNWCVVVDLAQIVQKTYEPLFLEPNVQTPGTDSYVEQYRAKLGLKMKFSQAHGYAYNLSRILQPTTVIA